MKNIITFILVALAIPLQVKAHNKDVHEMCLKANDYEGCVRNNSSFNFGDKMAAIGAIAAIECMERTQDLSKEDAEDTLVEVFEEMNISRRIMLESDIIVSANKISYLFEDDCETLTTKNEKEMEEFLLEIE